ncbi:clostripain-related cysteine peptidase [Parabacteroides sp. OttesenSCG-928-G07]|nr:clostripain-related cysteine peptidase [Parabacteroides sp. OttesenSCG-928-G07]
MIVDIDRLKQLLVVALSLGLLLAAVVLTSCQQDNDIEVPADEPPGRVLLVYMGGDNNLSAEVYEKTEAIRQGWRNAYDGELFIYTDPGDAPPKLYRVQGEGDVAELVVVRSYPEENSASSAVFSRVISEVVHENPAKSYGLLVFSHASGWLPQQTLIGPRSIIIDGKEEMNLADMAAAIPDGLFDFIVFEACFMAGIEVAYELKEKTDYIVASSAEIVSPGFTPVYGKVMEHLFKPKPDLRGVIETVYRHYNSQAGYRQSATFSVIHTPALDALGRWIRERDVLSSLTQPIDSYDVQHFDRYTYRLFFDFEDYYSRLLSAESEQEELSRLVDACVPYRVATEQFMEGMNGFPIRKHSGLTTYILQERFPYLNQQYKELRWYREALGDRK